MCRLVRSSRYGYAKGDIGGWAEILLGVGRGLPGWCCDSAISTSP